MIHIARNGSIACNNELARVARWGSRPFRQTEASIWEAVPIDNSALRSSIDRFSRR